MYIINLIKVALIFSLSIIIAIFSLDRAIYFFLNSTGPVFKKLGQFLSTRPDLVGKKIANRLAKFQDNVKPFSSKKVRKIIHANFHNFSEIFEEFDFNAVSSASIAQVHKAKLKDNKKYVAVKILRPNIRKKFNEDIIIIKTINKFFYYFNNKTYKNLNDIIILLEKSSIEELNLINEAQNTINIKRNLINLKEFYVPEVYKNFTSENILIIEWIDGIKFTQIKHIPNLKFDKKILAKNFVISYFEQVYRHGLFHADMHKGNLILMNDGRICAVDYGIIGRIDKKTRIAVAEIFIGFLNKDYARVAKIHVKANLVPPETNIEVLEVYCKKIGDIIVGTSVKDIPISKLLANLIEMIYKFNISTKPDLLLLQKTLLLVEGVGVSLDPELNIWEISKPWLKEWAMQNISFDAKMRDSLLNLLQKFRKFIIES